MVAPGAILPNTISFSSKSRLSLRKSARTRYAVVGPTFLTVPRILMDSPAATGLPSPPTRESELSTVPSVAEPGLQSTPSFSSAAESLRSCSARIRSRKPLAWATRS